MKIKSVSYSNGVNLKFPRIKSFSDVQNVAIQIPEYVFIPTKQIKDVNPTIVVAKGDKVKIGSKIAIGGANIICSTVSGVVESIETMPSVYGGETEVVVVKNDKKETMEDIKKYDINNVSKEEIINSLKLSSIVDYDGETLLDKVIHSTETNNVNLIINLLTDELYQLNTPFLIDEKAEECVDGIKLLVKLFGISSITIAFQREFKNIYNIFFQFLESKLNDINIKIYSIEANYPAGDELQLVNVLSKKPFNNIEDSRKNGNLVLDVFTIYSLKRLIVDGEVVHIKPISIIDFGNKNINTRVGWVKVGTTIMDIFYSVSEVGLASTRKLVAGGPMRGVALGSDTPSVTMGLKSIMSMTEKKEDRPTELPCITCGKCEKVCPVKLVPYEIEMAVLNQDFNEANRSGASLCTKCGCCSFICPAKRHLTQRICFAKEIIELKGLKNE